MYQKYHDFLNYENYLPKSSQVWDFNHACLLFLVLDLPRNSQFKYILPKLITTRYFMYQKYHIPNYETYLPKSSQVQDFNHPCCTRLAKKFLIIYVYYQENTMLGGIRF